MKIICEVSVHNRLASHVKPRSQQSTIAIGYHPPGANDVDNLFLIHFTATNKVGTRYKIKRNVEKVFTKFIQDGKTTLSFKQPPHDLQIRCESVQLKSFLNLLKLAIEGKCAFNKIGLSTLAVTALPQKIMPIKKMSILSPADYPVKGLPKSLVHLNMNGIRKYSIDSQMLNLINLRVLNLSNNCIEIVPNRLGEMALVELDLSQNHLHKSVTFNSWSWMDGTILRATLQSLNLSNNKLTYFPYKLVKLHNLAVLKLNKNELSRLPFAIRRMKSLRFFHLADNKFESMPNLLSRMVFDTLDVSGDEMFPKLLRRYAVGRTNDINMVLHQPPTLLQVTVNTVIGNKIKYSPRTLPFDIVDFIEELPYCECGKLCFPTKIYKRTCLLRISAKHFINSSGSGGLYGDSVYCNDFCELTYRKYYFDE